MILDIPVVCQKQQVSPGCYYISLWDDPLIWLVQIICQIIIRDINGDIRGIINFKPIGIVLVFSIIVTPG